MRKRILAFVLAAAMVLGDAAPVMAAELPEGTGQEIVISDENSEAGGRASDTEELPETDTQKPSGEVTPDTADTETDTEKPEAPGEVQDPEQQEAPEVQEDADTQEEMLIPVAEEEQLQEIEMDASEYILQAGGTQILPEAADGGIALFTAERVEDVLAEGLKSRAASIDISSFGLTAEGLKAAYVKVLNANPSLFYVNNSWRYSVSGEMVQSVLPEYLSQYDKSSSARYEAAVNEALGAINDQMDDVEKALALHDYLVLYCAYEKDGQGPFENYNAYNALVDGEAVCQGYTLAYTDLLQRAGISVSYATSDAMNHIWNLVELDNNWYHVDTTWDDPTPDLAGRVRHGNFLRSDDGITEEGHHDWVTGIEGITCTDDSYASGQFWNGVSTAVFYEGDSCYYMSGTGQIWKRSGEGAEEMVYVLENTRWPVWGGGGYWSGVFTGLSRSGDYLYCNDKDSVYRISISSGTGESIYDYEDGDGYLYGSCVRGDELRLAVAQDPNTGFTKKIVPLPEEPREPLGPENPIYTWNTIDGETADSSAPGKGRMKLLVFAPQWAYSYMSSFYYNPLFRDNKYIDVIILDTQGQDVEEIQKNLPKYYMEEHPNAPVSYCYYKTTETTENPILQAYNEYRVLTNMEEHTEDIRQNEAACFLINSSNEVVYSDSYRIAYDTMDTLVDNLMDAINENKYLRSNVSVSLIFRKDEQGYPRFEWEKNEGIGQYLLYGDVEEANVQSRNCEINSSVTFDEPGTPYGRLDEGYAQGELTDAEGRVYYYQIVLLDRYGLQIAVSDIEYPKGKTAENLNYTWNTVDGGTINSANETDKLKVLVFASMKTKGNDMGAFYGLSLFRGKKYVDAVILDTSKSTQSSIKNKRDALEAAEQQMTGLKKGTSALIYCYGNSSDGKTVEEVFQAYCAQIGAEIEYNPENVGYFLIDQNNQIVDYFIMTPEMVPQYAVNSLANYLVNRIRDLGDLSSGLAAPASVWIEENKTGRITVAWEKAPGAAGYDIYRSSSPEENSYYLVYSYQGSQTEYVDTSVSYLDGSNEIYYYKVVPTDSYGIQGAWSAAATNKDLPMDFDSTFFKEMYLVDEAGNRVDSIEVHVGELKKLYLELERFNGQTVRLDTGTQASWVEWSIIYDLETVGEESVSFETDSEEQYIAWWYEDLINPIRGGLVGIAPTDAKETEQRYLRCYINGIIDRVPYAFQIFIPVHVEEAEEGVIYPPIESPLKNCYMDREELNQYIRDEMVKRTKEIVFCVPMDTWMEWEADRPWDMERDVMDFYQDREGMKSWEGDYLWHSVAGQTYGPLNSICYQGTNYYVYAANVTYWDSDNQEQKVGEKLDELIWNPGGALYSYHDAAEYEIVEACVNWIQKNVSYIGTPNPAYHSAYSALFNGRATCEGYSLLLYRMLREFGISNRILMGIDTNAHTYNIVEIDGKYYYTDATSGVLLKGSNNFEHAVWQEQYQQQEFTENVTSRISETDYNRADAKWVRLYETVDQEEKGQLVGSYKTLAEAKEAMVSGRKYRMDLLGAVELKTADELNFLEDVDCTLNLNGRTLTVPLFAGGVEARINADLYGGSSGKGSITVAAGQSLYLGDAFQDKAMTLRSVSITGTPDITIGRNVNVDAASNLAVGALIVPEASTNVVLDGTVTAKTLEYSAADMIVNYLTVSGQTTIKSSSTLSVKSSAAFGKVSVENGIFNLNLVKILNGQGETVSTGTATFKDTLNKSADEEYAVQITRMKMKEGASGTMESDPFMPEDALITITGTESAIPTRYFQIPKDPYGRELSPVREGNILKVKGVVVEVSLKGQAGAQKYISIDAAVAGIGTDFGGQKGTYQFTFLSDAVLTKNLILPACVEKLELKAAQREVELEEGPNQGQLFAALNFQGFTLSTAASVTLYEGLELISVGKQAKLNLTGTYGEEAAFQVVPLSGEVTWIDALGQPAEKPERRYLANMVEIAALKGTVVLRAGEKADYSQKLYLQNISAKGLFIEDGTWVLDQVVLTEKYQVAEDAAVMQINVTLTNAVAEIDGVSELDNLLTMSNTRLLIGETGRLSGMLTVKTVYKNESAANGYTVENYGQLALNSLNMTDGTLYNSSIVQIETVKNSKNLINDGEKALFITKNFNQNSKGKSSLRNGSVIVVGEKAVLYNAELGGAYFYQTAECSTALNGKNTVDAALPEGSAGLEFVQISKNSFEELCENLMEGNVPEGMDTDTVKTFAEKKLPAEEIIPQTCLFTTNDSSFPTQYVSVRQMDPDSPYTKVYQMGSNVRVGKEWIVISARKMADEDEERLEGFILWSDAMNYLSNLSNPNMVYIIDILEDVDIEQGLTMPGKAAGLVIRGTEMPAGENETRKNVLTYTGDLNLTMPLEFSGIELKAKKNNADYESVVNVKGMQLTFSNGASAVFSSLKGTASSVLAINGKSKIEVHGDVSVGQLWSDGGGTLIGLAAVTRDKAQNITAVTPKITISGQTDIRNGQIEISLKEKVTENKVTSYPSINFSADEAAQICMEGVRIAKAPYAKPGDFIGYRVILESTTTDGVTMKYFGPAPMSKKDGYLVCYKKLEAGVKLIYGSDGNQTEIPFKTFAEAVAEINNLKRRQAYTIQIQEKAAELSKESPAALTMPNKNYISDLCIEAAGTDGEVAEVYYLNGLSLTSDTVLKNIAFKQMVKSGKEYVPVEELKGDYPTPVSVKTGGFALMIDGKVTFNTPLSLEGGTSGTFTIEPGASLVTVTNGIEEENEPLYEGIGAAVSVIAGSVKKFKTFDIPAGQEVIISQYGTVSKNQIKYTAAELNVTGMTIGGSVLLEGGNAVVKNLVLNDGALRAMGENAGKVTLTNVILNGSVLSEIYADRDFTISGTLDNQMENAELYTRQKPVSKNVVQMPYLNITGKVTSTEGDRITVCVLPNDCNEKEPVILSDAPKASGQLLTAKTAGVECFAADPANLVPNGSIAAEGKKGELYSPENPDGYMLVKSGNNIYVYDSEQIAVALCKGDVSDGNWSTEQVINYYPGWAEAVTALNALNQTKETYTLLLLKDVGVKEAPLKLTLPSKAAKVYVASIQNSADAGQKEIYYQNALSLGTHTEFVNVTLHPVTAKGVDTSLGISSGNFDLALRNVQMSDGGTTPSLKNITGKGNVILDSENLWVSGEVSGVKSLTIQKKTYVLGAVKANDLILQGTQESQGTQKPSLEFITKGTVAVTNLIGRGGMVRLTYERTNKNISNLTVNGDIQSENGGSLQLNMQTPSVEQLTRDESDYVLTLEPLKNNSGEKTVLSDTKKLAVMPKASTSDFEFLVDGTSVSDRVVKANKGLYLADEGNNVIKYAVELEMPGGGRVRCLDFAQAVNEINTRSVGTAEYILYLPENYPDTNITDNNPYGPLTMPGNGKAAALTLSGPAAKTWLTFSGNISINGNLKLEDLVLNPVKGNANMTPADFNITVSGNAKNGASLTLDNVQTVADLSYWDAQGVKGETGYINQISGTKNVTNITIRNSSLRLKTGVSNVNILMLEETHMITCKASALNALSVTESSWDALGVTTLTNITRFDGADSYLAGKQDSKKHLSQLTINGKADAPVNIKVIAASDVTAEIQYVDSYKDVALLKAPKEAAGTFTALWDERQMQSGNGWVESDSRVYYKDTANYILCGDIHDMVVKLTGAGAETYAKSWQDAVTIINNLNEPAASYTMELLQEEILTGKSGTFGGMTFPANNKAAAVTVKGSEGIQPVLTFSGNLTTYGNVVLEDMTLRAIKNQATEGPVPFSISVNGVKGASSLTLRDVQIDPAGGALKDINGNNKASVILDSEGLTLSGGISGTPSLTVQTNTVVKGAVKADVLTLKGGITFTAEGAVTVTDIENTSGQNTLTYGRTVKNASNLTINGSIMNETEGSLLCLNMILPEGKSQKDYELALEALKTTGSKTVLSAANKLAVMPKASTSDFEFRVNGQEHAQSSAVVKANKGIYLAGREVAERTVELSVNSGLDTIRCLDLTQAVNEINTLADGEAKYILYLPGDYMDTNLTDGNPYGTVVMPGSGKAGSLTVSGSRVNGGELPTLTFSGGISIVGNLTLEHLILNPVKSTSNEAAADFNLSATGNAKIKASLTLDDVQTKADAQWDWDAQRLTTKEQKETTGFINQISGTKNITDVTIRHSELRLKTGVSNVNVLALENTRMITCKTSAFNDLSVKDSAWDTLGAATITNIAGFEGAASYLAGKQDSKKYLPQLTVNGRAADTVTLKVIAASNLLTEIQYVDSYQDTALVKASKESAGRFQAFGENDDSYVSYKDTSGYVLRGSLSDMEVKILEGESAGNEDAGVTYAKCWQNAVTIINNVNEPKAFYTMELLRTGITRTGKDGTVYAGLTLPSKTAGITVRGIREEAEEESTLLAYTGTLKPGCPVEFEDIVLTEGTLSKNIFTPTYQITLALGNVNVSFRNTATLKNPSAGAEELNADLTVASASASKGILTLENEKVYAKGNFVVLNLHVAGDVVLISDKAMTLTDIIGEGTEDDAGNARLVLDAKMTAITRAGQQSATQISIKGKIQDTELGIAPQIYDLSRKSYHRLKEYEARALLAAEAKPDAGKKLANVSKTFADTEKIQLLYSYNESSWSAAGKATADENMDFYVYNSGVYVK